LEVIKNAPEHVISHGKTHLTALAYLKTNVPRIFPELYYLIFHYHYYQEHTIYPVIYFCSTTVNS